MKRLTLFVVAFIVFYSGGLAYAQHGNGHGAGGTMGMGGMDGDSDAHSNAGNSAAGGSAKIGPESASTQLTENQHLNTALTKALGKLVPSGGLTSACQGFTNLGRCISAIHVANNRDINFFCLREELRGTPLPTTGSTINCPAGTTPKGAKSLGAAIQFFDPNADSKAEASKGMKQANTDIDTANHSQT